jgi:carboxylate-amine ligase
LGWKINGFKSYRQEVFAKFPRTGLPSYFSSVAEFDAYVNLMVKTGTIDNAKIWWDLRVHPFYPTIEFRICDMPLTIDETVCLAAIMQSLVAKSIKCTSKILVLEVTEDFADRK